MNTRFHRYARKVLLGVTAAPLLIFVMAAAPQQSAQKASGPIRLVQDGVGEARLLLGFADRSGIYLANVRVRIKDHRGNQIAELVADGPWLDLQVSPGTYHVTAVFEGAPQELRNVNLVNRATITQVLYWDLKVPSPEMMADSEARSIG